MSLAVAKVFEGYQLVIDQLSPGYARPHVKFTLRLQLWPCGAMDNASAYGAEDSRFESWQGRILFQAEL